MAQLLATPFGLSLPYPGLFAVSIDPSNGPHKRPSEYFWDKAISPNPLASQTTQDDDATKHRVNTLNLNWLDEDAPAISDGDGENCPFESIAKKTRKNWLSARLRRIGFRSFFPSAGSKKNSTVIATEFIHTRNLSKGFRKKYSIFHSWKIKSRGTKMEVRKMVAVVKKRISSSSPPEDHPQTWAEYQRCYSNQEIDIDNPPQPPSEQGLPATTLSAFDAKFYFAPKPVNESLRQLVVNRLELCGKRHFDPCEDATARAKERIELGDKLIEKGQGPQSLDQSWEVRYSSATSDRQSGSGHLQAMSHAVSNGQSGLTPETLEQHPVFRKIVSQCREMFGAFVSMLTVTDDDRSLYIAEAGAGGVRVVPRDSSFCAHTILSTRKGFVVLDTQKDWRFQKHPLATAYGIRFYAGVPLMPPNLDSSVDLGENDYPIGTLCIMDVKPRDSFESDDRKRMVYLGEYARREIQKWFLKKIQEKTKVLEASEETWYKELEHMGNSNEGEMVAAETVPDSGSLTEENTLPSIPYSTVKKQPSFRWFKNNSSNASTPPTSVASHRSVSRQFPQPTTGPSVFEDITLVVNPERQKVFDLATKLVGDTLELSVVYLLAVAPPSDSEELGRTQVISTHNMPQPLPMFNVGIHLDALRAPEGGLLYQNPSEQEIKDTALLQRSEARDQSTQSEFHSSAMLVGVGPVDHLSGGGFVLAGLTTDTKRVFGGEDVLFMKSFATKLRQYTSTLKL